jgi:hypothetical protein
MKNETPTTEPVAAVATSPQETRPLPAYLPTEPVLRYLKMLQNAHMQAAVSIGQQIESIFALGEQLKANQPGETSTPPESFTE